MKLLVVILKMVSLHKIDNSKESKYGILCKQNQEISIIRNDLKNICKNDFCLFLKQWVEKSS